LQAAIASLHSENERDRAEIAALYGELARVTGSPVVQLNRAVAIAEAGDPAEGLELLETIELDGYHYLDAARAELLTRLGRPDEARRALERALELVPPGPEERLLRQRLAGLDER
jgi:RNA polymerase sigma-70 factor (ECF subfamily)